MSGGTEKPTWLEPRSLMLEKVSKPRIHWSVPLGIWVQDDSTIMSPVKVAHRAFVSLVGLPPLGP